VGRLTIEPGQAPEEFQRVVVLRALDQLYCPAQWDELNAYASTFAEPITELPVLRQIIDRERGRWSTGTSGEVLLCPALQESSAASDAEYLTRSDWKLENRLVGPAIALSRSLWLLRVFCDLYLVAEEDGLDNLDVLFGQIAKHARNARSQLSENDLHFLDDGAQGVDVDDIERIREAAEDAHSDAAGSDRPNRLAAVDKFTPLTDSQRLFGA
jgi:hypothetical protein